MRQLQTRIEKAITDTTGKKARFAQTHAVGGGSINDSRRVILEDGREFFIKTHPHAENSPEMYVAEFEALSLLEKSGALRVPKPVCYEESFLVLELFKHGTPCNDWQEKTGNGLAQLHRSTQTQRYGFERDNYLGITPQHNNWTESWLNFWREQRLGWQLELFSRKTDSNDDLLKLGDRLLVRLDDLLGQIDEPAVLLHGDLWSGNAAADEKGEPIIFDPASYYGHREAEFGMMRMFGGFGPRCEAAYDEVWPFAPGFEERVILYRLYHELNHLNLFGRSYYQSCLSSMQQLL